MAIIQAPFFLGGATESAYVIEQSLMFDGVADYLKLTPVTAGSTSKATYSFWVKRSGLGDAELDVLNCETDTSTQRDGISFGDGSTADVLSVRFNDANDGHIKTNDLMRDPTAWQHWVVAIDTGQSTAADRVKIYKNGTQITSFATASYPSQGYVMQGFMQDDKSFIGTTVNENGYYFDGYLADFIGIDGIQLAASAFGETDTNGIWIPKDPSSTDNISDWGGVNSFWLKFADATNLGFNSRPTELTANAGTYKIDNSLWLDGSADYLYRTPSSGSASTKYTLSTWFKRGTFSEQYLFMQGSDASNLDVIEFTSDHRLQIRWYPNTVAADLITTQVFRDPSAWQHLVISVDTTLGTAGDRIKIYVNGVRVTAFDTQSNPSSSATSMIGGTSQMTIGRKTPGTTWYYPGYLAEYIFLDGYAGTASDFGGWDVNGNWLPVDPSGLTNTQGQALIAQGTGSAIGSMSTRTANAFDGDNDKPDGDCATNPSAATTATIGKDFGSGNAKAVNEVKVWGYNGGGFTSNAGATCTIAVIGSNTGLGSDEVTLFTSGTIADTTNSNEQNFTFSNTTAYRYVYIQLTQSASNYFFVAELEFYNEATIGFGTNGFHLDFALAEGDGNGPGNDISGNNNDFTNYSITAAQTTTDSPTNTAADNEGNYPVWNLGHSSIDHSTSVIDSVTEGNLRATVTSNASSTIFSTMASPASGKYMIRFVNKDASNNSNILVGLQDTSQALPAYNSSAGIASSGQRSVVYRFSGGYLYINGTNSHQYTTGASADNTLDLAWDADTGKVWIAVNGTWQDGEGNTGGGSTDIAGAGTGNVATLTSGYQYAIACSMWDTTSVFIDQDGGTLPTDFKRFNTANLPATTVTDPRKYWSNTLYTGTAADRSVRQCFDSTGTAWTPDFVWIKNRTGTVASHHWYDVTRGANAFIKSNNNDAQDSSRTDMLTSFDSGGFSLGVDASEEAINKNNDTYVAWCWKAGDSNTSVSESGSGSGAVNACTHRANTTSGFSIIKYTGFNDTISNGEHTLITHGLGSPPVIMIGKSLDSSQDWFVLPGENGGGTWSTDNHMHLNTTDGSSGALHVQPAFPTSTAVKIGNDDLVNKANDEFIMYAWIRVPGLVGYGTYTGNAVSSGAYVNVDDGASGFRPAWVMVKRLEDGYAWHIHNSAMSPHNPVAEGLNANDTGTEATTTFSDFTANGFKLRAGSNGGYNGSATYIYLAFADQPFNLAKAR